jgi:8-oxo-(d)GTP phosphatase
MAPARRQAPADPADPEARDIVAAGAVVLRPGRDVLLVHRPKYDDWSFPKGKRDRGEHLTATAVREVEEETGLRVRLGRPLARQRYRTTKGMKQAHYWLARVTGADDVTGWVANDEIDEVAWVPVDKAARLLSYRRDRDTLAEALEEPRRTTTLLVVRHALARARRGWYGDDRGRPLVVAGRQQADRLVPVLGAYGVRRVVTSSSTRCVETVAPYCLAAGVDPELLDLLSEEGVRPRRLRREVRAAVATLADSGPTALCSHRPVLPEIFAALGVDDPDLEKADLLVVHLRKGRVVAVEQHGPRS